MPIGQVVVGAREGGATEIYLMHGVSAPPVNRATLKTTSSRSCAGGFSAIVNVIRTKLSFRSLINSALAPMAHVAVLIETVVIENGRNGWHPLYRITKHQIQFEPDVVKNERAEAGRTTESRKFLGQGKIYFPCSTDHEQDW